MNIRRFRVLHENGSSYAEIACECGVDPRTVKKYLQADADLAPPRAPSRAGCQPQVITPFAARIEAWLRGDVSLKGSVIYERLMADHGFTGHYQRVKMHLATVGPLLEDELFDTDDNNLRGLLRRFEVLAGAQGQVDWGEEGDLFALGGKVFSFHMTLSYSRDPFCCFTSSGPRDVLGLPPPGVRALRGCPRLDRRRPDQDRHQAARRTGQGRPAVPAGRGVRRALRLPRRPPCRLPPHREGTC